MTAKPGSGIDLGALSIAERILLAGELLDMAHSLTPPFSAAQIAELEQHDADADAGLIHGERWEAVKAALKRRK